MFASGLAFRRLATTIAVMVGSTTIYVVVARPAGAATMRSETAIASWLLSGTVSANVSLEATEVVTPTAPTLFFSVSEQFCDTANDQEVFRQFLGQTPVRGDVFVVSRHLASAAFVAPRLVVSGTEQRLQGCIAPSGIPVTVSLGTSTASLLAAWRATGPVTVVQPGVVARPAAAVGFEFSAGPLNLGALGSAQSAQLLQQSS
jgi:hypothetical protein